MHKIITSDFEIDLSGYNISIQEENSWFSDTFFTKYSYPFDLLITDEINKSLGDMLSYDSRSGKYYIECQYVFYDQIHPALLIVEQIVRNVASVSLKYGMDEFPNFQKKLNELDLEKKDVQNIFTEAELTIYKTYPSTNYNFPQIHTEKFDPGTPEYNGFRKIINNRIDGNFLQNTVENEDGEDIMYNRNIIQPMPYLMYVLHKGFELSGLTLTGDIVSDNILNKILLFSEKDPFVKKDITPLELVLNISELNMIGWTPASFYQLEKTITITQPGKYNIVGNFSVFSITRASSFIILKNNEVLYSKGFSILSGKETFVDLDFIHHSGTCEIKVIARTSVSSNKNATIFDLQILPIYYINASGEKETNLLIENHIDLNRYVPNITFGELVTAVLNMFNYDVDQVTATNITINRIQQSMTQNAIKNLSEYENIDVVRKLNSDISFLFKYEEEGEIDLGGFYIDKFETNYVNKEFNKETQNSIQIPVYPLQNELISDVYTAKSVQSSEDKICFVMYAGPINNNNYTTASTVLAIPNLIEEYHYNWLYNRVHSIQYNLTFIASANDIVQLNSKFRLFFLNNIHLIKNITKNQLSNEMFEVELETETLIEM